MQSCERFWFCDDPVLFWGLFLVGEQISDDDVPRHTNRPPTVDDDRAGPQISILGNGGLGACAFSESLRAPKSRLCSFRFRARTRPPPPRLARENVPGDMAASDVFVKLPSGKQQYLPPTGILNADGTVSLQVAITSGGGSGAATTVTVPKASANSTWGAGAAAGTIVAGAGYLYYVTATAPGSAPMTLTDGSNGAEIGYIPANFSGDIPIYSAHRFVTGVYANSGAGSPAITIGTGTA